MPQVPVRQLKYLVQPSMLQQSSTPIRVAAAGLISSRHSSTQSKAQTRFGKSKQEPQGRRNYILNFVPQKEAWFVSRGGEIHRRIDAGPNLVFPFIERIEKRIFLGEQKLDIEQQISITQDNVTMGLTGSIFFKSVKPYETAYEIEDYKSSVEIVVGAAMRQVIGNGYFDTILKQRASINNDIINQVKDKLDKWGIVVTGYEVIEINIIHDETVKALMQQSNAERIKRSTILLSEGEKESALNKAQGEAGAMERLADAQATATIKKAEAVAQSITIIAKALQQEGGKEAVAQQMAGQYLEQLPKTLEKANAVVVPYDFSVPGIMATAQTLFNTLNKNTKKPEAQQNENSTLSYHH